MTCESAPGEGSTFHVCLPLVAAQPDRANPFRSPKARFKRARLIMQSLGQSFADRDPQIGLHWLLNNYGHAREHIGHLELTAQLYKQRSTTS